MSKYILGYSEIPDSVWGNRFCREILEKINSNPELIQAGKAANAAFLASVREAAAHDTDRIACDLIRSANQTPRLSYCKNLIFNGKQFTAEIDHLLWRVNIV